MNGGTNSFFNSPYSSFNFWDVIISGANGEPDVWEGSAKRIVLTIGMEFHWVETAVLVKGEVRSDASFDSGIGALTKMVARQVMNVL